MSSRFFQTCFRSLIILVTFQTAFGLRFSMPGKPLFQNQSVNLTWVPGPGDPSAFNLNAICNNITIPVRNAVRASDRRLSIPVSVVPRVARYPYGSCVLRATDPRYNKTLTSSVSFVMLSQDLPTDSSSSVPPSPTITTTTIPPTSTLLPDQSLISTGVQSTPSMTLTSQSPLPSESSNVSISGTFFQLFTTGESSPGQVTAVLETTDSMGNVWTIIPGTSAKLQGGPPTPVLPGYTQVERTTTMTFVEPSSTSFLTLTYTTNIPIQSAPSSSSTPVLNHAQVASIAGGVLGSLVVFALLAYACLRCRRRGRVPPSKLEPLMYDSAYRQPPEKSARLAEQAHLQTQHTVSSTTQVDLEVGNHAPNESLEALTHDAINARRLRLQVQRMSERILELEDQQREIIYTAHWGYPSSDDIGPPDYADADSYTYTERITHG